MISRKRHRQESQTSILSEETTKYLSLKTCRVCLKTGETKIFGENDISGVIMDFGCIEISPIDNLPQYICVECHSLLKAAILFRKTAKNSEEILKNSEYLDDKSVSSENLDYKIEKLDSDDESTITREYLEYEDSLDSFTNLSKDENSCSDLDNDKKDIEKLLKKQENDEFVMIIVSDKDKEKPTINCNKCNIEFENKNELENHIKTHSETNFHKCDICQELISKSNYKLHIKRHRDKYKENHDKRYGKVECKECGKKINRSYYKYHMKMHGTAEEQAERLITCTLCTKSFSSNYYADHMRRVHYKKQKDVTVPTEVQTVMKCPICDKMINEDVYKEHLAKHGGPTKRYICDQCGKVFKRPSSFKTHTLTHGGELKYQCQFCPYRGLHLGLLKIHVRTHTGDYNYKCTECPARFITKSNLSKHLRRHRGAFDFKCAICNKGFYTKRDVDKHTKTVHLELKNNICNICFKGFGHRDNMLSHQLKVHKRVKITEKIGRVPSYLKEEMQKLE